MTCIYASRIGVHSHIKGLGCNHDLDLTEHSGFIGQESARKSAFIISCLLKNQKTSCKIILFLGPRGSGKTALANGILLSCQLIKF